VVVTFELLGVLHEGRGDDVKRLQKASRDRTPRSRQARRPRIRLSPNASRGLAVSKFLRI
jgi:hypothetical protein